MNGWIAVAMVSAVLVTLGFVWTANRVYHWKEMYQSAHEDNNAIIQALRECEADKTRATEELESFKAFMNTITKQPLMATLTDTQVGQLVHSITEFLNSTFNPAKLKN